MPVPTEIRTPRFLLRPWRADDASELLPVLEANREHLGPWIPTRVSTPVPVPELAVRLAGFGADFAADREWRYGMFAPDGARVLGEIGLYPRAAVGRVPYAAATCVELGYWLRSDATGQGLITEASEVVLAEAAKLDRLTHAEIRCDARNLPSAAIPKRLGFVLAATVSDSGVVAGESRVELQVWVRRLPDPG
jgi:RimJ/RimL family protein N-acetyltransferase